MAMKCCICIKAYKRERHRSSNTITQKRKWGYNDVRLSK